MKANARPTCLFDVNETLLDLSALDPAFVEAFGDKIVRKLWFRHVLHSSLVLTLTGGYEDFGKICRDSLRAVAKELGQELPPRRTIEILKGLHSLPAHFDVAGALPLLRENGCRLFAFSNSPVSTMKTQLRSARILEHFDGLLSVESVRQFKPAPEAYLSAARKLGRSPSTLWLIATHPWDIAGAAHVELKTARVRRAGVASSRLLPKPDLEAGNLHELVEDLLVRELGPTTQIITTRMAA